MSRLSRTRAQGLLLAEQAEQDVLGADVVVLERACLFLGKNDDLAARSVNRSNIARYFLPRCWRFVGLAERRLGQGRRRARLLSEFRRAPPKLLSLPDLRLNAVYQCRRPPCTPAAATPLSGRALRERGSPRGSAAPEQQHHEAVDAESDPARRRHAELERLDEGLVEGLELLVVGGGLLALGDEARALLVGIVELGEGICNLDATGEGSSARRSRRSSGAPWQTARARPDSRRRKSAPGAPARRRSKGARRRAWPTSRWRSRSRDRSPRSHARGRRAHAARRCRSRSARGSRRAA